MSDDAFEDVTQSVAAFLSSVPGRPAGAESGPIEGASAPGVPAGGGPVWDAVRSLRSLLDLIPDAQEQGESRLEQCIAIMRAHSERDQFPDALVPDSPRGDGIRPITYPRIEVNQFVEAAKPLMLGLIEKVELEGGIRKRLARELAKPTAFLEADDRGTVAGVIEPTGMTREKERNNAKLDALAAFLHALRRQPYAVIWSARQLLGDVAIPPDLLSADPVASTVVFRSRSYAVSELTCHFVRMLIAANGGIVSTGDLQRALKRQGLGTEGQIRPDRLKAGLPEEVCRAIATDGRGSRLLVDRLLSYT